MLSNKWVWIAAIVLAPFLGVWIGFGLAWALGFVGAAAVLLLFAFRERPGRRKRYIPDKDEPTLIGGQTGPNWRFYTGQGDVHNIPYSIPLYHIDPAEDAMWEDDDDDEDIPAEHVVFEFLGDNDEDTRSTSPRRSGPNFKKAGKLFGAPRLRDADKDPGRRLRNADKDPGRRLRNANKDPGRRLRDADKDPGRRLRDADNDPGRRLRQ